MRRKEVIEVETKREWNFIAKFYFVCIIVFVLLVAYIVVYRYTHWDEVQSNIRNSNNNQEVVENTIEDKISESTEEIQVANAGVIEDEEKTINNEISEDTSVKANNQNTKETKEKKTQAVNPSTTQQQTQVSSNSSTKIQSNLKQTTTETTTATVPNQASNSKPVESFKVNNNLINQMKNIINSNPSTYMKQLGYNIVVDSSIVNQTTGFTFTETRVKNAIVNSFGTIRIYARDYYVDNELRWSESFIL